MDIPSPTSVDKASGPLVTILLIVFVMALWAAFAGWRNLSFGDALFGSLQFLGGVMGIMFCLGVALKLCFPS